MLRATAEQIERVMDRAREHSKECRSQGIEPTEPERFLIEAFEVILRGDADDGDVGKSRDDYYQRRTYSGNYNEP
jgi:hypothetical protein